MSSRSALPIVAAGLLLLTACREAKVAHYRIPKEKPVAAAPAPDMAGTAVPTGKEQFTWTAPAGWTAKEAGPMRKGSYAVQNDTGAADLSITAFPGDTGGLAANLNRWRNQIGLPPLTETQLGADLVHLDANGLHFDVAEYTGEAKGTPTRILGAILSRPGETWFFKLMGPDAAVAREKATFLAFLQTVKAP